MKVMLVVALCLLSVLGYAGSALAQSKEIRIGVAALQMRAPFFVAVVRGVEAEASAYRNVKTLVADGGGDVAEVSSDIEDLLAKGVDGFIMNISPLEALPGPLAAIKRAASRSSC